MGEAEPRSLPEVSPHLYLVSSAGNAGPFNGTTDDSGNWGNIYFRNVRTFQCTDAPTVCS